MIDYKELDDKCLGIRNKADKEISELRSAFIIENSEFNIGDIIEDHHHIIKVENICVWSERDLVCKYSGTILKKDLTPKIRQFAEDRHMYSSNKIRLLK